MPILDINNRTENWKTATLFAKLDSDSIARLAARIVGQGQTVERPVELELFWHGARDYIHGRHGDWKNVFSQEYQSTFGSLSKDLESYAGFQKLNAWNYDVSREERKQGLYENLVGTEIDIVIETPNHLLIGEAKDETDTFNTDGNYVLVHQLVRQYVMAQIIVNLTYPAKKIVPFIVGSKRGLPMMMKRDQFKFMVATHRLRQENALTWDDLERLHP